MAQPRVALLSVGGTIASASSPTGSGVQPNLGADDLLQLIPGVADIAEVEATTVAQLPSSDMMLATVLTLAREARDRLADGCAGVVVTHGTDTIEETALALDLLVGGDAPVVVTGAMRNPTLAGADGPANLLASIAVATSRSARGLGCLVVLNDEIHSARFVRKSHTASPSAFVSTPVGPIGWLAESQPRIGLRVSHRLPLLTVDAAEPGTRVALVTVSQGDDPAQMEYVAKGGYDGLVVAALGGGHVPSSLLPVLGLLQEQMPVVFASRTGAGEVLTHTYGFAGSESDLVRSGLVSAGILPPSKARMLLMLMLAAGVDRDDVRAVFAGVGAPLD
jgi:L-asparaginase